jgi:hypothetical protein
MSAPDLAREIYGGGHLLQGGGRSGVLQELNCLMVVVAIQEDARQEASHGSSGQAGGLLGRNLSAPAGGDAPGSRGGLARR